MTERIDPAQVKQANDIVEVASRYVKLKKEGQEYVGLCPFHQDTTLPGNFKVNGQKQIWACFACNAHSDHGADLIGLVQGLENTDFVGALKLLSEGKINGNPQNVVIPPMKKAPPRRTFAPPADKQKPDMAIKGVEPSAVWTYHTADGQVLGYVARYPSEGKKEIRCWTWGNHADHEPAEWACKHFAAPRPLYNLHLLENKDRQIILVEGEKTADAAALLFPKHIVMAWPGGAGAVGHVDWTPLQGRKVVLVPDNDEAGRQAMERIAAYLYANGADEVKGIDPETQPDKSPSPEGWDLADAAGWTSESTLEWAKPRRVVYPKPTSTISEKANLPAETPTAAPDQGPTTQDTAKPAPTQPTHRKSKPELGVVEGNTIRKPIATGIEPEADLPPEFSEFGMAESWILENMQDWRYTTRSKEWRYWNGNRWALDETNKIHSHIKSHIIKLNAASRELTPSQRNRVCTDKTVSNIRNLCGADQRIAVTPTQWDADPLLLGTPSGTVDLKTGLLRETRQDDMITKSTAVSPEPGPHPWWDRVLERAHKGNAETAEFIQRWCGYMLTGDTREEKFLLIHGPGGGGKSKFLTPLKELMGEYHKLASFETFTTVGNNRGSVDEWARLSGARLVTASEPEEGARWREGAIKQATGRDGMTARHMYQSTFDYMPQFKLVFMGNHKPQLRSIGEEMRRRIDLLEWSGSIPQEERIANLPDMLREEYPAILHWMIEGAMMWQQKGLTRPEVVATNTSEYMEGEDVLGQWMDDCLTIVTDAFTLSSALYESFSQWCEANGEYCPPMRRFSLKMEERGFVKARKSAGRGFMNVVVRGI